MIYTAHIRGTAPLLHHRYPMEDTKKVSSKKKEYDDMEQALLALYQTADGVPYQPAIHLEVALQQAAVDFVWKGRKSFKDLFKSAVFITPERIPHKIAKWEIDKQPVVVNKAKIIRCRPRFDEWELAFNLEVLEPDIEAETLRAILAHAGARKGIGDYRPRFGRFEVVDLKKK